MDSLELARAYIDLGPNDYVCCASAYTQTNVKHTSSDWLKPYLLLYDKVFVDEVGSLIYNAETSELKNTYQWLLDERLIDQYPRVIYRELRDIEKSDESSALLDAIEKLLSDPGEEDSFEGRYRGVAARWEAAILADLCNTNTTCLERSFFRVPGTSPGATAMRVIVNEFPVPVSNVPFEDLMALRADGEFVTKRNPLRNWCRKLGELSEPSIRDELASQLNDYQKFMEIQKIKCNRNLLQIVLGTPLGIIEDLMKFRFEGAIGRMFKVSEARIALAEAELKAPSRELALFVEARNRLPAR
jgi:hypothetical protein